MDDVSLFENVNSVLQSLPSLHQEVLRLHYGFIGTLSFDDIDTLYHCKNGWSKRIHDEAIISCREKFKY